MPELPEVETVRRALATVVGVPVVGVRIARRDVIRDEHQRRDGPLRQAHLLAGDAVGVIDRRGKQLALIGANGRVVLVHLGMSGQVLVMAGDAPKGDHAHLIWSLADSTRIVFRDPRRFGGIWLLPDRDALDARWADLGPDALGVTTSDLVSALGTSSRAVKPALLDQRAVAGVGNIYADESLFEAGIAPTRPCRSLSESDWAHLATAIRSVMERAVLARGSTLRDYRLPDGSAGGAAAGHRVYGRGGKPCPTCDRPLNRLVLAQRSTCWCPFCQS
jgi:formamidopyrimidine-DNA glycosylase